MRAIPCRGFVQTHLEKGAKLSRPKEVSMEGILVHCRHFWKNLKVAAQRSVSESPATTCAGRHGARLHTSFSCRHAHTKSNTTASPVVLTPRNRRRHISHAMPLMASLASASPGPAVLARRVIAGSPDCGFRLRNRDTRGASRPDGAGATPRSATGPRFPVRFVLAGRVRGRRVLTYKLGSAAVSGRRVFTLVARPTFDNCPDVSR
jgi:hypothetical protein